MKFYIGQTVKIKSDHCAIGSKFRGARGKVISFWKRELPPLGKDDEFAFVLELETMYFHEVYGVNTNIVSIHEYYLEAVPNI